jgi:AAA family ATP:ADP antiporter
MNEDNTKTPNSKATAPPSLAGLSWLDRALRIFTDVRRGEGLTGVIMLASVFLMLTAYYLFKPAREGLLATSGVESISKTELKAYTSFGQGLLFLGVIPAYSSLVSGLNRRRLITVVNVFFAANAALFWVLQPGLLVDRVPYLGIAFYLWVGIFNVLVIAQFWSFAADLYSEERGKRIIPMIAIGASAGAVAGSWLTAQLVKVLGTYTLLLLGAGLLMVSLVLARVAEARGPVGMGAEGVGSSRGREPMGKSGAMKLVFSNTFLIATAFMILVLNWVNTNGENAFFGIVQDFVSKAVAEKGITDEAAKDAFTEVQTTEFYGSFQLWVNVVGLLMQSFLASRLLKYGGFGVTLMLLPFVAFTSYTLAALLPVLGIIRVMKIAENSTDYSINNTAKQVLWLPTSREVKYKAKAAIDTLFVRFGDGFAALTVFVLINRLRLSVRSIFVLNIGLALAWIILGFVVVRQHRRLSEAAERGEGVDLQKKDPNAAPRDLPEKAS